MAKPPDAYLNQINYIKNIYNISTDVVFGSIFDVAIRVVSDIVTDVTGSLSGVTSIDPGIVRALWRRRGRVTATGMM